MRRALLFSILLPLAFAALSGCASFGRGLKSFISGEEESPRRPASTLTRFSENENVPVNSNRQYRRMNRQRFEEEADLKADAGSLWVMEGQGAYLFAQNQTRMVGDLLNVKIEGAARSQLLTKVRVIARLLERLDASRRGLASQEDAPAPQGGTAPTAQANEQQQQQQNANAQQGGAQAPNQAADAKKDEALFPVEVVPTRIVEQLKDGSYRVRGLQAFMIGKREYKVVVTGIVRQQDFDDSGIDSSKLLDPQFDIVSAKKGTTL